MDLSNIFSSERRTKLKKFCGVSNKRSSSELRGVADQKMDVGIGPESSVMNKKKGSEASIDIGPDGGSNMEVKSARLFVIADVDNR